MVETAAKVALFSLIGLLPLIFGGVAGTRLTDFLFGQVLLATLAVLVLVLSGFEISSARYRLRGVRLDGHTLHVYGTPIEISSIEKAELRPDAIVIEVLQRGERIRRWLYSADCFEPETVKEALARAGVRLDVASKTA